MLFEVILSKLFKSDKGQYLLCDFAKIRNIKRHSFLFVIDKKDNSKGLSFFMRRYDVWRAKTERDTKTMYLTYVPKMVHAFNIISVERR